MTLMPEDQRWEEREMKSSDIELVVDGDVAILSLNRPHKRNAIRDQTIACLGSFFAAPPPDVKAVLIKANGDNFSAGLTSASTGNGTPPP